MDTFVDLFRQSTGVTPYKYQERMAMADDMPKVLRVETGLGKTAAVVLSWLWRRRFADMAVRARTPRRLVYCLPQRALVTQTERAVQGWLEKLGLTDSQERRQHHVSLIEAPVLLRVMMGGDLDREWDRYPELDQIIVGTQDQLLSRALNRGYAMSRYRWPVHYALLNNDTHWVIDECQLMESGLATTVQLQAFRDKFGTFGPVQTTWMSATLEKSWLETVDYADIIGDAEVFSLRPDETQEEEISKRLNARKQVVLADWKLNKDIAKDFRGYAEKMVTDILKHHVAGTLTLVVVNRVARAQAIMQMLQNTRNSPISDKLILVHSRFRSEERWRIQQRIDEVKDGEQDAVIVATQAVEAGVDLSARTLITELAPWSSLVQRFGRCNRKGEAPENGPDVARIILVELENDEVEGDLASPYSPESLQAVKDIVYGLDDAAPARLPNVHQHYPWGAVLRRREVLDWFDTTSDLSGYDVDISPYVRGSRDTDVQVLWREVTQQAPPVQDIDESELCRVSISQFKEYLKKRVNKESRFCWCWNPLGGKWDRLEPDAKPRPGEIYCLDSVLGGYDPILGFAPDILHPVAPVQVHGKDQLETNEGDPDSRSDTGGFVTLEEHTRHVVEETQTLVSAFEDLHMPDLVTAAKWHDVGKAHPVFQAKLLKGHEKDRWRKDTLWAKSPTVGETGSDTTEAASGESDTATQSEGKSDIEETSYVTQREAGSVQPDTNLLLKRARFFRHELASAIAYLEHQVRGQSLTESEELSRNLIAYLIAAHHGKVRVSIRSLPGEPSPEKVVGYARGVWEGDCLREIQMEGLPSMPQMELHMDWMQMGANSDTGQGSWAERVLCVLESYGPFRLAWLESMLRVADWRGSARGGELT